MTARSYTSNKGFTLIELLVVIGILAILLAITLIAINPARQFGQANDTARRSAATQILNAIGQYTATNGGNLPAEVLNGNYGAQNTVPLALNSTNFPNLCGQLVPSYLPALPVDPNGQDQNGIEAADCANGLPTANPVVPWDTQYQVLKDANNRITVIAPNAYAGPIQVTR